MQIAAVATTSTHRTAARARRSAPLEAHVAHRLLDLLGSDDAFRRLFRKDPKAALAAVGHDASIELDASPAWACMRVERLASKAQIAAAREALLAALTGGLGYLPIQLDAGRAATARRRKE
jgi:putative modified peptide